ncbi:response regulator [Oryzomonas sagensis]|nr:response regulator [Oryzomonas sagensis]
MDTSNSDDHVISILYVDDEQKSREVLGKLICHRYPNVRLLFSANGKAGVKSFKRHRPEIVITDVNMPISDGISMAAEIKTLSSTTEIIVLTACSNTEHLLQAIEVGVSHYILKPINIKQVFKVVDKAIDIIRSKRVLVQQNDAIMALNAGLAQKAAELELANQALGAFNYTVAHDLRSPLVVASGFFRVLCDNYAPVLDDRGKEYLEVINREISRMNSLIEVLLKFSMHSQGAVNKSWTCLSKIADEISGSLLAQDRRRNVTFHIVDGIFGYGDPDLLQIVLENLLGNAWKYSSKTDDARIEFGAINKEDDLVYFVHDNGAGFDQRDAEKLFVPFQRLQCNDEIAGMGIGLATAHRIILRHGGRIWADGEIGKGATFYFTL